MSKASLRVGAKEFIPTTSQSSLAKTKKLSATAPVFIPGQSSSVGVSPKTPTHFLNGTGEDSDKSKDESDTELSPKPNNKEGETKAENGLVNRVQYTREQIMSLKDRASPREEEIRARIESVLGASCSPRGQDRRLTGRAENKSRRSTRAENRGRKDRRGGQGRGGRRPESPLDIEVKALEKSDSRYIVKKEIPPDEVLIRRLTSILNKLTPENFEKLVALTLEVKEIDSHSKLRDTVSAVFEKAISEPAFSPTYADFALRLSKTLPTFQDGSETHTFKRVLLNKCQAEFERDPFKDLTNEEEITKKKEKCSLQSVSLVNFMQDELFHQLLLMNVFGCYWEIPMLPRKRKLRLYVSY